MKTDFPKITVVTPTFKSAKTLESTIKSTINQGYPNLEYIIIDGGDPETVKILEKYDESIDFWVSEKDRGQYDALYKGFSRATGDILCWINADDMFLPRSLFVVAEIFEEFEQVQWISSLLPGTWDANGNLASFDRLPGFSKKAFLDGVFLPGKAVRGYWIQQESTFFRRDLFTKCASILENARLAGDFALWCEFYKHADLVGVEYPLSGFRQISGQRSLAIQPYMDEASGALESLRLCSDYSDFGASAKIRFSRFFKKLGVRNPIFSYEAKKIVNVDLRSEPADWALKQYNFTV